MNVIEKENEIQSTRIAREQAMQTIVFKLLTARPEQTQIYVQAIYKKLSLELEQAITKERQACLALAQTCPEGQGDPPMHVVVQLLNRSIIECVRQAIKETKQRIAARIEERTLGGGGAGTA